MRYMFAVLLCSAAAFAGTGHIYNGQTPSWRSLGGGRLAGDSSGFYCEWARASGSSTDRRLASSQAGESIRSSDPRSSW
jgi:hypothetical protein